MSGSAATAGQRPAAPAGGRATLVATVLASSMVFVDSSVVNVALPALQADFGADLAGLQWVVEAYFLTLVALMLTGGALGDRLGRRRVFLAGTVLFAAASLACALAPTVEALIAARAAQGAGGALLVPGSLALIASVYAEAGRGRAIGTWSAASALTVSLAPLAGGWLIDTVGWRAVFWINLPLAAAVVAVARARVPESRDEDGAGPIDLPGTVLAALGLGALVFGLVEGPRLGFASAPVLAALVAGSAGLAAFLAVQAKSARPMMPLGLFADRAFATVNAATLLLYAGFGGALFLVPLHLMTVLGFSALAAGAALLPLAVLIALMSRRTGAVVDRWGARLPLTIGPLVTGAGLALLARPGLEATGWAGWAAGWLPAVAVMGVGMGITVAPLTTAVMNAAPRSKAGIASGINNALSRVAFLLAIALLGVLATAVFRAALPPEAAAALGAEVLKLGAAVPRESLPPADRAALADAIDQAALAAFRTAVLAAAGISAAAGLVAAVGLGPKGTNRAEP